MTIDREGLRTAIRERLLGVSDLSRDLQIDTFEGHAESDEGREQWFDQFLQAEKGGIAVSYAGSQERDGDNGRTQEAVVILLLYARYEAAALGYLTAAEDALDGAKVSVGGVPYWVWWAADQMTGRTDGYYEYEVRLRIATD